MVGLSVGLGSAAAAGAVLLWLWRSSSGGLLRGGRAGLLQRLLRPGGYAGTEDDGSRTLNTSAFVVLDILVGVGVQGAGRGAVARHEART